MKVQILALAVAALVSVSFGATQHVAVSRLSLYDAAAADVVTFAQALAQRGTPVGLVIPETVFAATKVSVALEHGAPARTVQDALMRFNGSRANIRAMKRGRTVLVRAADEPDGVRAILEQPQPIADLDDVPAGDAIFKHVASLLEPGFRPTGVVSTGPLPGPGCPIGKRVRIPAGDKSPLDLLNQVVERAPSLVWLVTYDADTLGERLKIGYLCPDGVHRRMALKAW